MKKLLLLLAVLVTACKPGVQSIPSAPTIEDVVNTAIQSDAVQNAVFYVTDNCPSTLNDIEFCDYLEVKDSYTFDSIDQVCVDAAQAELDATNAIIDETRGACKTACATVDWTCNDCCSKECQSAADASKDAAMDVYNAEVAACSYTTITGGYDLRLDWVKGAGTMVVSEVNMKPTPDEEGGDTYSLSIFLNIPTITAQAYYKVWQDPIPAIAGTTSVNATNIPVYTEAKLTGDCDSGYYLQLTSVDIKIPDNVFDSNELLEIAQEVGMDVSIITGGQVDLNQMLIDWVDGYLDGILMDTLNGVLKDISIPGSDCTTNE